jgi:hypothetical protein
VLAVIAVSSAMTTSVAALGSASAVVRASAAVCVVFADAAIASVVADVARSLLLLSSLLHLLQSLMFFRGHAVGLK